ncbi:MAG: hypothetical protein HY961_03715, partial [Ignavibacteriae bacterium]|nr:hypothetical protein [Ignavibacteriota bacterium]
SILRPVSVTEVALAATDFVRGGSILPRAFAAEFSPGLLIGGRSLSIREYQAKPFWYRARISLASRSFDDNTGRVQASLGVRLTLMDDADPRTDAEFIQNLSDLAQQINRAVARKLQSAPPTESGPITVESADIELLEEEVEHARAKQRDAKWNANMTEVAAAVRFTSFDSLAKNARADKYQAWLAGSFSVAKWGQFIFNLSGSLERNVAGAMDSTAIIMDSRFYFGSNDIKVFGEGQIAAVSNSPALYLFSVGGEINPVSAFWLEFAAGFQKFGSEPAIIKTAFQLRWNLPEGLF